MRITDSRFIGETKFPEVSPHLSIRLTWYCSLSKMILDISIYFLCCIELLCNYYYPNRMLFNCILSLFLQLSGIILTHLSETAIYTVTLIALFLAAYRMKTLTFHNQHEADLEDILILISYTGLLAFIIFR